MSGHTLYPPKAVGYSLQTIHSQIVRSHTWRTYAQQQRDPCTWKVWKERDIYSAAQCTIKHFHHLHLHEVVLRARAWQGKKRTPLCPGLHIVTPIRICHSFYMHIRHKVELNSWKRYKISSTPCPTKGTIVLKTPILETCLFLKTFNTWYSTAFSESLFQ